MSKQAIVQLERWHNSPLLFVTECLGATPTSQQADALVDFPKHRFHTIRSGHGTGKDAFAAWIILWFLSTRTYPKIPCTAPTAHQLRDILWAEINKWLRQSALYNEITWQSTRIYMEGQKEEWFATAITCNARASAEEQAEALAGMHGDHLLFVIDEASGVPDPVYLPVEGAVTGPDNYVLQIGNMTRAKGYFYDSHYSKRFEKYHRKHWRSDESENVTKEWVEFMKAKYGEDSNTYRIRVLGEPPLESPDALVPLSWAQSCIGNDIDTDIEGVLSIGVDVARFGADTSVMMARKGDKILDYEQVRNLDTEALGQKVLNYYWDQEADIVAVDEIGVGAGVTDWLKKRLPAQTVFGVNVSRESSNKKKFFRLRDELWWAIREKCEKNRYSFPANNKGEELVDEITQPKYIYNDSGAVKIESKKEMKLRGIASPDIAEALLMTEYVSSFNIHRRKGSKETETTMESVYGDW